MDSIGSIRDDATADIASVVFVAFQDQDNLGVGYLASTLMDCGYTPYIVDFRLGQKAILRHIQLRKPVVVGFSVIFQYHIHAFGDLIRYLRRHGITCHFTAGGHYPSLRWSKLMEMIPELDSVVLFEGEHTLVELVKTVAGRLSWDSIQGIALRRNGRLIANPLRPLEEDLDNFPPPLRPPLRELSPGCKFATLLASRGCRYNCVFCSIRQFYSQPPGRIKRTRRAEFVVEEMVQLHEQMDCSIFMFQDDDFPVGTPSGKKWVTEFCSHLTKRGLAHKVLWKINCRPDEVEEPVLRMMREHGLFLVYMGIESGTDVGLRHMNKRSTIEQTLRAVNTLKRLNICFDYGFMLFAPWSTALLVREDIRFLRTICGDGSTSVTFCKMLPYAETDIERQLLVAGKTIGPTGEEDYDFDDPAVARIHDCLNDIFYDWVGTREGFLNASRCMRYELAIPMRNRASQKRQRVKSILLDAEQVIATANNFLLDVAEQILDFSDRPIPSAIVAQMKKAVGQKHDELTQSLEAAALRLRHSVSAPYSAATSSVRAAP